METFDSLVTQGIKRLGVGSDFFKLPTSLETCQTQSQRKAVCNASSEATYVYQCHGLARNKMKIPAARCPEIRNPTVVHLSFNVATALFGTIFFSVFCSVDL